MATPPMCVLRRAGDTDATAAADVFLRSRHASAPDIPPPIHSDGDIREWFTTDLFPRTDVWIAELDDVLVGMMVLAGEWLDQLYIDADMTGKGIGSKLLEQAKVERESLDLWTFQSNHRARRFYENHGFVEVDRSEGDNEEGEPDVRYHWPAQARQSSSATAR